MEFHLTDKLEYLCATYNTPLQLYDESMIRENVKCLLREFNNKFFFQQFFAVKALPNPNILKILLDEGCGLDCSSMSELYIAKKLNVSSEKIMFTSNYTNKKELEYAVSRNCIINLDDLSLVHDLYEVASSFPEIICFRLNPGIGTTQSESISNILGGPDAKFGISRENIVKAYQFAKQYGATRFGIHMMTGSCVLVTEYWIQTINILIEVIKEIETELNIHFEFINIGGGLGIPYKPNEQKIDIQSLVETLYNTFKINNYIPNKLYMENGRYITGPYGWLISKCHVKKESFNQVYYGLDACMANLMRPGMYNAYHHISIPLQEKNTKKKAHVVGTLCENNDWFAKNRELPICNVGDIFVIHDTGAHSHSMGFQYNGKLRCPEILYTKENEFKLIRTRETIESLYENCIDLTNDK